MCGGQNASHHFNTYFPTLAGAAGKNLPPNFFGKKDESKQMKKGKQELISVQTNSLTFQSARSSAENIHSIVTITDSLGLIKIQCTKLINEENHTCYT